MTRDEAQILLNDHLGEYVVLEVIRRGHPESFPILKVGGELRSAAQEFFAIDQTPVDGDTRTVYWLDGANRTIDLGQLDSGACHVRSERDRPGRDAGR